VPPRARRRGSAAADRRPAAARRGGGAAVGAAAGRAVAAGPPRRGSNVALPQRPAARQARHARGPARQQDWCQARKITPQHAGHVIVCAILLLPDGKYTEVLQSRCLMHKAACFKTAPLVAGLLLDPRTAMNSAAPAVLPQTPAPPQEQAARRQQGLQSSPSRKRRGRPSTRGPVDGVFAHRVPQLLHE